MAPRRSRVPWPEGRQQPEFRVQVNLGGVPANSVLKPGTFVNIAVPTEIVVDYHRGALTGITSTYPNALRRAEPTLTAVLAAMGAALELVAVPSDVAVDGNQTAGAIASSAVGAEAAGDADGPSSAMAAVVPAGPPPMIATWVRVATVARAAEGPRP